MIDAVLLFLPNWMDSNFNIRKIHSAVDGMNDVF